MIASQGTVAICIPECDPIAQDCGDGMGCYWATDDFNCIPISEDLPPGAPCETINGCAPGAACINGDAVLDCASPGVCATFRDTNLPNECYGAIQGMFCQSWFLEGEAPWATSILAFAV